MVNRLRYTQNLLIYLFSLTIVGPFYYGPPISTNSIMIGSYPLRCRENQLKNSTFVLVVDGVCALACYSRHDIAPTPGWHVFAGSAKPVVDVELRRRQRGRHSRGAGGRRAS